MKEFGGIEIRVNHMLFTIYQSNRVVFYDNHARIMWVSPTLAHLLRTDPDKYFRMIERFVTGKWRAAFENDINYGSIFAARVTEPDERHFVTDLEMQFLERMTISMPDEPIYLPETY